MLFFLFRALEVLLRVYVWLQVRDPQVAEKLTPRYGFACKRPTFSSRYLRTFNRANTELVTASIDRVCKDGIATDDGRVYELDAIIWATGYFTSERGNVPGFEVYGSG